MHEALRELEQRSRPRWAGRLRAGVRTGRAMVLAFLAEALPTDPDSRAFHLLGASYAVLAMTDPELAEQPFVAGLDHLERELAEVLRAAAATGELPGDRDPRLEAARLVALNHGVGTTVLAGQRTPEHAEAVLRYHVDRVFGAG